LPHPLLHRGASGNNRRGHDEPRALAEAQSLPRRPGADLPALANVAVGGDVSQRAQPAAPGAALRRRGGVLGARLEAAPPPQSLPALSRPGELAGAARGAEADGEGRSHRPRQAPAGPGRAPAGAPSFPPPTLPRPPPPAP